MSLPDPDAAHHYDTARLEAFSDGVFAIAITLLIIEIGVPHVEGSESLPEALARLWPSYFGYVLSFVTIGIMWANHHGVFKDIDRVDHTLIVLNLLLLMAIAFLPFPTAVLADYLRDADYALPATLTYGATLTVIAVFFNAMWLYASRGRRLIDEHVSDARLRSRTRRYLFGPLLYGVTIPLAFTSVWISLGIITALALLYLLPSPD
jgi:uncharacterized membrane protein